MWVDSVGLLDFKSSRSLLGLMASLLSFPSQPVTDGPAHYQFEVSALQPGQLFREQRYALTPRAGHTRDVGAPEPARGAEGVVEPAQVVVDVAKRVRLIGVARRAGRLHRDVGIFREREHVRQIRPPLTRARVPPRATEVIEDQLEVWVPLGDLADLRQKVRRHHRDRQAGPLCCRPQPVDRAVCRPLALLRPDEGEATAEHSRALLPRVDQRAALRLVEGEVAEDREPVGMRAHGLYAELVRVRIPRRVRREDGGIDAAGVHLLQGIFFEISGDLPVPRAGGVARIPEMNLRVDDQHGWLLCWKMRTPCFRNSASWRTASAATRASSRTSPE